MGQLLMPEDDTLLSTAGQNISITSKIIVCCRDPVGREELNSVEPDCVSNTVQVKLSGLQVS